MGRAWATDFAKVRAKVGPTDPWKLSENDSASTAVAPSTIAKPAMESRMARIEAPIAEVRRPVPRVGPCARRLLPRSSSVALHQLRRDRLRNPWLAVVGLLREQPQLPSRGPLHRPHPSAPSFAATLVPTAAVGPVALELS